MVADVAPTRSIAYRADIDGLRALAITLVVAYHYGVPGFSGGFVGVDVFFVLSGYLITQILCALPGHPGPKLLHFAARRAKRLLPSAILLVVVFAVLVPPLVLTFDVERYFEDAIAFLGFHSNILYYDDAGYFDADAREKVLLHTWSLSIEWQFYAIWALALTLALWLGASTTFLAAATAVLIALSLAAAIWVLGHDRAAAFYLVHYRFWEFLAGALIALLPGKAWPTVASKLGAPAGVGLILGSALLIDESTVFPGLSAVPAIVGTTLFLATGATGGIKALFGGKWPVLLGQVSYSWYLWHWPLLILFELMLGREAGAVEKCAIAGLSLGLSILLWRYFETPFRRRWQWSDWSTVGASLAAVVCVLAICLFGKEQLGWPLHRADPAAKEFIAQTENVNPLIGSCVASHRKPSPDPNGCLFGSNTTDLEAADFVVLGDSHGDHWIPGFAALAQQQGAVGLQLTAESCPPIRGIEIVQQNRVFEHCRLFQSAASDLIENFETPRTIILAARWSVYFETTAFMMETRFAPMFAIDGTVQSQDVETTQQVIEANLAETVRWLKGMGHNVILLGQAPEFGGAQRRCVIRRLLDRGDADQCGPPVSTILERIDPVHAMLLRVAEATGGTKLIVPANHLCDSASCRQVIDGEILYRDANHLNVHGSQKIVSLLADEVGSLKAAVR